MLRGFGLMWRGMKRGTVVLRYITLFLFDSRADFIQFTEVLFRCVTLLVSLYCYVTYLLQ